MVKNRKSSAINLLTLSLLVLALLLAVYFIVNIRPTQSAKASELVTYSGYLFPDRGHRMPCNAEIKLQYVLRDLNLTNICLPVIMDRSLARNYIFRKVTLTGNVENGIFYVKFVKIWDSRIRNIIPLPTVYPAFTPVPESLPVNPL